MRQSAESEMDDNASTTNITLEPQIDSSGGLIVSGPMLLILSPRRSEYNVSLIVLIMERIYGQ